MRFSLVFCLMLFAAHSNGGENAAPIDGSKLQIGWLTKDGAFPNDSSASASFPRITLDKVTLKDITVQDKKTSLTLSGRVDDGYESILATPHLQEVRLLRKGVICGTLPLLVVKDPISELAPYARHFTFSGKIQIEPDDELVELSLVTPPNRMGAQGRVEIAVHTDKAKEFAVTSVDVSSDPPPESVWAPFLILIRAPAGTDAKALHTLAEWKHFARKITLMPRADQAEAAKKGCVDFIAVTADGSPLIMAQPWDISPPVLGYSNAKEKAERVYLGMLELPERKDFGGKKRKLMLRAIIHDVNQPQDVKGSLKIVVKHNGIDWDHSFPDVPGDVAGEFQPRINIGVEWDAIEPGTYEGTMTLCEEQIPAANFGGIRK